MYSHRHQLLHEESKNHHHYNMQVLQVQALKFKVESPYIYVHIIKYTVSEVPIHIYDLGDQWAASGIPMHAECSIRSYRIM